MIRFVLVLLSLSLPAMADSQSTRVAKIESLSSTFSYADLLAEKNSHPLTAIVLDGCIVNFIEYFGHGSKRAYAVVVTDDLSLISLSSNNKGDFTDSQRSDANWVALLFATSDTAVIAEFYDLPSHPSPREIVSSQGVYQRHIDWARYLNFWYPNTMRVETIADALIDYQSDYCKPGS